MQRSNSNVTPVRRWNLWLLPALVLAAFSVHAGPPTVYTVGTGAGCDFSNLRDALGVAAVTNVNVVQIRESRVTDNSLGYSYGGYNSEVSLTNQHPSTIYIDGGYADCSAATQTIGHTTTLGYYSASVDQGHTLLTISNAVANGRAAVILTQITMQGSNAGAGTGPAFGGAVGIYNNAALYLFLSKITGFNASNGGGGVFLSTFDTDRSKWPNVALLEDSSIDHNSAQNGGGVEVLLGRVHLDGGSVYHNHASRDGGGIYLVGPESGGSVTTFDNLALSTTNSSTGGNHIDSNTADGNGGGIFSEYGQIVLGGHPTGLAQFENTLSGNKAASGGAIYVAGPDQAAGGPYTLVRLHDTLFGGNQSDGFGGAIYSLNAVDLAIDSTGGECTGFAIFVTFTTPCSLMELNTARGSAATDAHGGAIYLTNDRSDGASRGIVRFTGTYFAGNKDTNGLAAVAATGGASEMVFHRDIFTGNSAANGANLDINSALIYSHNGKDVDFRYNTVLDSNTSTRMFSMNGGNLNVLGSILWGTVDRSHPFHFVAFLSGGASISHRGCVLVRSNDNGMAGFSFTSEIWNYAPHLDSRFAPAGGSAALDNCSATEPGDAYTPPPDAYGDPALHDTPGVMARQGNYDLGAVEQSDIIFTSSFGPRGGSGGLNVPPDYPPQ
ncbi:MAG: hypothetical protein WBW92_09065 [Rhodanobacteraceae bacterium]